MNPASKSKPSPIVRLYQPKDRPGVRQVCADTGFLGNPIDPVFQDRDLFADFLTAPYTDAEPECCWVWEGAKGEILGYVLSSRNARTHRAYLRRHFPKWLARAVIGFLFTYKAESRKYLFWLLFRGRKETPPAPSHGVHFHINLLPEARGQAGGRLLFDAFLGQMAELRESCVYGQVVTKGDRRGERMFAHYGFRVTHRSEVTKYREHHAEPVFLCTVIYEPAQTSPCAVKDRTSPRKSIRTKEGRKLLLSLHDCHPGSLSRIEEQMKFCLSRCPGHASVLVVPEYHHEKSIEASPKSLAVLHRWQKDGHDLAVHGYYHDRRGLPPGPWWATKFYTNQEAEFIRLDPTEAARRIDRARDIWKRQGWSAVGFVAPGWLYEDSLEEVVKDRGFAYTCRLTEVRSLVDGRKDTVWAGAYSLRSGWRRALARGWHPIWKSVLGGRDLVRLSLHPQDLEVPFVRRQVGVLLEELAQRGYRSTSYAEHVQM